MGVQVNEQLSLKEPVDESLMPEEYLQLGLPAHDRKWTGDDMGRAEMVLSTLAQTGFGKLPRYQSKHSGEVFARLTSPDNLDVCKDRNVPIGIRNQLAAQHLGATNRIIKIYSVAFAQQQARDIEMIELKALQFRSMIAMLDLVDEGMSMIKKDDPSLQAHMRNLEQIKLGLAMSVSGSLRTLTEHEKYRETELVRLVGYLQEILPQMVPRLSAAARLETFVELDRMQTDPCLKGLQPGLRELQVKVNTSLETTMRKPRNR